MRTGRRPLFIGLAASFLVAGGSSPASAEPIELILEKARTNPSQVQARILALEAEAERRAERLGLSAGRHRALPTVPEEMAYRVRALGDVADFLEARREMIRPRLRPPAPRMPRGRSVRASVIRNSARLGITPPDPQLRSPESQRRWSDIERWLTSRHEVLRDIEQPLLRPVKGAVYSPFGPRGGRMHQGIDIPGPSGTPIRAAAAGRVIAAGSAGAYGNQVVIQHPGGLQTSYAHLSSIAVSSGPVEQGRIIGGMGTTGRSTGVHLHFEVRVGGRAVDPLPYLRGR